MSVDNRDKNSTDNLNSQVQQNLSKQKSPKKSSGSKSPKKSQMGNSNQKQKTISANDLSSSDEELGGKQKPAQSPKKKATENSKHPKEFLKFLSLDVEIQQMVKHRKSSIAMGKDDIPKDSDYQSSDQEVVENENKESSSQLSDASDAQQKLKRRKMSLRQTDYVGNNLF